MDDFSIEKENHYSLALSRPGGRSVLHLRFSRWVLRLSVLLTVLLIAAVGSGIYYVLQTGFAMRDYKQLRMQSSQQAQQLQLFDEELDAIQREMSELIEQKETIQRALGAPKKKKNRKRRKSAATRRFNSIYKQASKSANTNTPHTRVTARLAVLRDTVLSLKSQYLSAYRHLQVYMERYASTPTDWPVYGNIRSDYGWRIHPKTGQSQFHRGIDIPAWKGAPVKVTADGIVEFAGWGGGYGWVVIVMHDFGYRTLYAHLSEIQAQTGWHVNKGQIIGKIGDSGFTTGPHIHYEIRRWSKSISPRKYMGMDLFTAIARLW